MRKQKKSQYPIRVIALGFLAVILLGSMLLCLPFCVRDGVRVSYIDALYTATSAVCVTGLSVFDVGSTFTPIGQLFIALMIQIGGLGVAAVGTGLILAMGKKVRLSGRNMLREAMNLSSGGGIIGFLKTVFLTTLAIELVGAALSFTVFIRYYPPLKAIGVSLFHSVSSFNNAGFDILGGGDSLISYSGNVMLNLTTCALIICGGIGFLVLRELIDKRFRWRALSMHTKIVLTVTAALVAAGTLLFRLTEDMTWLQSLFQSVTARTAGFCTYPLGAFSNAGLIVMCFLMFVGASSGSTGGGVKTTTLYTLLQGIKTSATNKSEKAFRYSLPQEAFRKAAVIAVSGFIIVIAAAFALSLTDPEIPLRDVLFESVSAFSTAGLSTGITAGLSVGGKIVSICVMYIGRLGPLTIASLWYFTSGERIRYPQGNITIG